MTESVRPPLVRDNLSDQVARYVQTYIREQNLRPGAALPSEQQIGRELGVSRGIVREAMSGLAAVGIVEVTSGKGAIVSSLDSEALAQLFDHAVAIEQLSPPQILQVRRVLEIGCVRLAAGHRTPRQLDALAQAVAAMESAEPDVDRFVAGDLAFHQTIARCTQNPLFALLVTALRAPIEDSIREGLSSRGGNAAYDRIHAIHRDILAALGAGDAAAAAKSMERHFDDAVSAILSRHP